MKTIDVVILVQKEYVNPQNPDWFIENIILEDKLLTNALIKQGLSSKIVAWDDKEFDWTSTKSIVIREIWDYHERFEEFMNWVKETRKKTLFINDIDQVIWNIDKHYLSDLKEKDINIPESVFIDKGSKVSLKELHLTNNWDKTVFKPTVSAGSRNTIKITPENINENEELFAKIVSEEDMMIQPFLHNIETKGEITLVMFGGKFSHAILKKAKKGDFRVQDDFGGTVHDYSPTQEEINWATETVNKLTPVPTYARIDAVWDNNENLAVTEIEMIEPELWFRKSEGSADMFAKEVKKKINN